MSLWGKLAGIGLGVAGVVTGNPALIAAGGSVLAGDVAATASKDAARTQAAAADRAMGVQRQVYDDARATLSPYTALGASAAGSLGSLLGLPAGGGGMVTAPAGAAAATAPALAGTAGAPGPGMVGAVEGKRDPMNASGYGGGRGGSIASLSGVQMLEAPDGTVKAVPRDRAAFYLRRGARPVGGGDGSASMGSI